MKFVKKYYEYLFLFLLFTLGFFLRAEETISHNFLFLIDQGRDMLAVKNIVFNHHVTLIGPYTSLQGVFQGPLWYYLLGIPTIIFNGDPWGGLFLMLTISIGLLLFCYIWVRKLFGINAALVTLFLLTVCPEAIAAATYTWNPHPMWLLIAVFIVLFYMLSVGNKKYHLFIWPVIAMMSNFETALSFYIFLASIIYFLLFQRRVLKSTYFVWGMLLAAFFFLPQILFDLRHHFLMTRSILMLFHGNSQGLLVHGEKTNFVNLVHENLQTIFINFLSSFQQSPILYYASLVFLFLFICCFMFTQYISFLQEEEKQFITSLGRLLLIMLVFLSLYPFPLRYWFLTGFELFYLLPICIILGKLLNTKISFLIFGAYVMLVLAIVFPKLSTLYLHPDYGGVAKFKGKYDAIGYIFHDAKGEKFSLLTFTPPVYTDAYDYLTWYYVRVHGGNIPAQEKKGTVYLLMEPDPSKPWSYNGWLTTVIKSGHIVYTKTLPSGLIVQKRLF